MVYRWNLDRDRRTFVLAVGGSALGVMLGSRAEGDESAETSTATQLEQTVRLGLEYLAEKGQSADGTFSSKVGPGVTALCVTAALRHGRSPDDPMVRRGLTALGRFVKPDGGIYGSGRLRNYETCVAMVCYSEANRKGEYNELLTRARSFVTEMHRGSLQRDRSDPTYGGVGYSGSERPDLSNTGYFIEALRASEGGVEDEAIRAALIFVSRSQNLQSKFNDTPSAGLVNDGGFHYGVPMTKVDPSTSPERLTANGGLRSYGSMSYTGLKSMIYAGLTTDDPRVKAAVSWIQQNYTVDQNPGMGTAGLFFYFHTFAAALDAAGIRKLTDNAGDSHRWREDLIAELAARQNADGSWSNANQRWFENDRNLATGFALLALAHCRESKAASQ